MYFTGQRAQMCISCRVQECLSCREQGEVNILVSRVPIKQAIGMRMAQGSGVGNKKASIKPIITLPSLVQNPPLKPHLPSQYRAVQRGAAVEQQLVLV